MCLSFCRPRLPSLHPALMAVSTPLVPKAWEQALASHSDKAYARYLCRGLREGFRISFQYGAPLRSASALHVTTQL